MTPDTRPTPLPAGRVYAAICLLHDDRGMVFMEYDANPLMLRQRMTDGGVNIIDHRCVESAHAKEIVLSLRQHFRDRRDGEGNWFNADWQEVVTAFQDWDTDKGRIGRSGAFKIGDLVCVKLDEAGVGEILRFRQEGDRRTAHILFHKPVAYRGIKCISFWMPLNQMKPLNKSSEVAA